MWCCEYNHLGQKWCLDIAAYSREDAEQRLWAMQFGSVLGPLEMVIPYKPGALSVVRLICTVRNAIRFLRRMVKE